MIARGKEMCVGAGIGEGKGGKNDDGRKSDLGW